MFKFYRHTLVAIVFIISLVGCAERNLNNISKDKVNAVNDGNKALILMQTTPIVPESGIFTKFEKMIEKGASIAEKEK